MKTLHSYIRSINNAVVVYSPLEHQIKVRYSSDVQFNEIVANLSELGFSLFTTSSIRRTGGIYTHDALFV